MLENNRISSSDVDDRGGTLTTNFQYVDDFENTTHVSQFARNSYLRSSCAGGPSISSANPLRTLNNNHYANLQVEDQVTYNNIPRSDDKKSLFKVPFPTSFKEAKGNESQYRKNGAGPLTKPPPSFLQPKSKYNSASGIETSNQQTSYQEPNFQQFYYKGKKSFPNYLKYQTKPSKLDIHKYLAIYIEFFILQTQLNIMSWSYKR